MSRLLPYYQRLKGFTIALERSAPHLFGQVEKALPIKEIYEPRVIAGNRGALPVSGDASAGGSCA